VPDGIPSIASRSESTSREFVGTPWSSRLSNQNIETPSNVGAGRPP
jgi:hypothetical protein